jgi:hypothetical protein
VLFLFGPSKTRPVHAAILLISPRSILRRVSSRAALKRIENLPDGQLDHPCDARVKLVEIGTCLKLNHRWVALHF